MTPNQSPTQPRGQISRRLAEFLETAKGAPNLVRTGLAVADGALVAGGYTDDHRWLCEHYAHISTADGDAVSALATRLVERLAIESDDLTEGSRRAVDALTADAARHLASSGDRAAIVAHMLTLDHVVLANLTADALIKLSDRDRLIEKNFQLRAQLDTQAAKAEQAAAEKTGVAVIA